MTVRLLEELSELEKLALIPISYSRLNTYFGSIYGCRAKYFYAYIVKEPQVFGTAATLGNIIHKALEKELEPGEKITRKHYTRILKSFEEHKPQYDPDGLITPEQLEAGDVMISEFVDRHEGETLPIEHKEFAFNVVVGPALINGFIDRVDIVGDRVHIIDYKSGRQEIAQKDIATSLQLGIYALVADKLFPNKEIYAELYYLKSGRRKGHLYTRDDLERIENELIEQINELIVRQNYDCTTNTRTCYNCDYAKNGVCAIGAGRLRR